MEPLAIIGYFATLVMGIVLGLLGAGGSILTIPILVYFFKIAPSLATSYSLGVVGIVALMGLPSYKKSHQVNIPTAIRFFIPSFLAVFFVRRLALPAIPEVISWGPGLEVKRDALLLLVFAVVMVAAARSMLKKPKALKDQANNLVEKPSPLKIILKAIGVGTLTGFLGAGGGFLIVPALSQFRGISMQTIMGTSLAIVAMNSLSGFLIDRLASPVQFDWIFFGSLLILPALGIVVGAQLNSRLSPAVLKRSFAVFVLLAGTGILVEQLVSYQ